MGIRVTHSLGRVDDKYLVESCHLRQLILNHIDLSARLRAFIFRSFLVLFSCMVLKKQEQHITKGELYGTEGKQ
jgi:hypothetical protein